MGPMVAAVETFLEAMGPVDEAAADVALLRRLAAVLDADPEAGAEVYREYRFAVKAVREAMGNAGSVDGKVVSLLERLGGAAVRDQTN